MLRKSALNFASQAINFVVSFGDRILLVGLLIRSWGADVYSDWATLLAVAALLGLAELGFQIQYGNRLSMAKTRGDSAAYARTLGVGLFFYASLAAALTLLLIVILFGFDFALIFRLRNLDKVQAGLIFGTLAVTSIIHIGRAALSQIYRSQGEFHRGIVVDSAITALTIAAAVGAAFAGASPLMLAAVYLAAEIALGWGGMSLDITRRYPRVRLWPQLPSRAELTDLRGALTFYALIQGLPVVWLNAPILIISVLALGGSGLVAFVVQRSLVNFGRTLSTMLSVAVGIELATLAYADARPELVRGVEALARLNAALAGALAAGLICFGPVVIGIWTAKPELASLLILAALVLPAIVTAASAPLSMLCMYADRPHTLGMALAVQLGLGVPATLLGGLEFGVVGVAFGVALGEIVGLGIILPLLAARSFHIAYAPLALRCLAISGLVGLWGAAMGWLVVRFTSGWSGPWLIAAILTWSLVGAALPLWLALPKGTRSKFSVFVRSRIANRLPGSLRG
jgi:hypothetical protein